LFHLVFGSHDGKALCADSVEKHEPASDVSIAAVDTSSLTTVAVYYPHAAGGGDPLSP
jgi:hypothetical protein